MDADLTGIAVNPWMVLPFGLLLALIAFGPLCFAKWWSRYFAWVSLGLGAITVLYYVFGRGATHQLGHTAQEYISFITLIGSLYIVSGGIHISVGGWATPWANALFLFVGALLSNVLGTTGASMLLIRPWIRLNKYRITAYHIVFFIFIVSNVGGCLTPIGDPPLYLGYIKGVPFWWVAKHGWYLWLLGIGLLLAMFVVVDLIDFRRAPPSVRDEHISAPKKFSISGVHNIAFLLVILGSVLFAHKPTFLREVLLLGAAAASWYSTSREIHQSNAFDFHPLKEVALLFAGIFATMMPALDWLGSNAERLGTPTSTGYFWASGALSSVLDNAPTYLSFLKAAVGTLTTPESIESVQRVIGTGGAVPLPDALGALGHDAQGAVRFLETYHGALLQSGRVSPETIEVAFLAGNPLGSRLLLAISIGAVFFGANTYIGNGPNFMVKAVADQQGVKTPSFPGYIFKYTLPFMLPMIIVVWWVMVTFSGTL